ncbi:probable LRR receptor-like serine/threonine-protein kinase At3g47570 [Rhodamnia argentea]|uniref:Probable LRR receptor-like serine/threonine-protein kinase At3g47570 n=1 Tax=Rhodamnia argentea TaxID=178133 RepID=A0ABM3HEA6_9MYRT|nr:probable LRR receptor-like serine/threonine-protein kinase At3g47570 [Rhodamnia argentea]
MEHIDFPSPKFPTWHHIFTIVLLLCSYNRVSFASNNETDRIALLEFKSGITLDPFGVFSSWNDSIDFCRWSGVTCSRRHHSRVTVLDLNSQKLSGSISPHVGNLSFLRELRLQNNSFDHEIPRQIGRLHRLRFLELSNNSLAGDIPRNISGCTNLIGIGLRNNRLTGQVPRELGTLLKLQHLVLMANNLSGSIPPSIGNLSSLEDLYLTFNSLSGSIPGALGQLTKLATLTLGFNMLSGTLPASLFNLSSLTQFDVSCNQIHGSLPATIGLTLSSLEYFNVASNQFDGSIPFSISNATNLRVLPLEDNNLSGSIPSFERLHNLEWFSIRSNHLGSGGSHDLSFLCSLTNASSLKELNVMENRLGGSLPQCIGNFSITLTALGVSKNVITGEIPRAIGNLVNLEKLYVDGNSLSGTFPLDLKNLQNLTYLNLSNNKLSGVLPSFLHNLSELIYLYLDGNNFQGHIPPHLDKCQRLLSLDLSSNNLSDSGIPVVTSLFFLNLSHNHLTGALPKEIGEMKNLNYMDISGNMLDGDMPSSLGNCAVLVLLRLQDNLFQGSIPQSLSSLRGIKILDLSCNNLSGGIPRFLEAFDLEYANLSFNNFEGSLPTEGVFKNATAAFVIGNEMLCGGIPEFHLPKCISKNSKSKRLVHILILSIAITFGLLGVALLPFLYSCWLKEKRKEPISSPGGGTWQNLPYGILLRATNGFSSTNLIGIGSFGSVYKGILENGTVVAVKVLNVTRHGALKSFMAECEALKHIRHRNLLKILSVCSSIDYCGNEFKALIYKFMVNGSLEEWLHHHQEPTEADGPSKSLSLLRRIKIAIDIASALDYLHNHCHSQIIHCDLKPSNVLLDDEMDGHVGDFGLAKIVLENTPDTNSKISSAGLRGTVGYAAPEYGMGSVVSREGDVYSYGMLLLEMFTGIRPTDESFKENLNLHNFVVEALPARVLEITDPILLQGRKNYACHSRDNAVQECLVMVYGIGIGCSVGVPRERMSITEAGTQLCLIRDKLHAAGLQG